MSISSANGTTIVTGPDVIQKSDFFVSAGILHPLVIGSIAVTVLFFWLRLGSNRTIAPITVFDWIINVGLGSTLAGIVNGNSLVRGLLALATMVTFQYVTSHISSNYHQRFEWLFHAPPLVVVFRGEFLDKVMAKHRISKSDVYTALRQSGHLNVSCIEAVIIEANGAFSIHTIKSLVDSVDEPIALLMIPAYKALSDEFERNRSEKQVSIAGAQKDTHQSSEIGPRTSMNQVAMNNERPPGTGWNIESVLPV